MLKRAHDYTLLLCTEDGTVLSQSVVDVDWQPAIECARLRALRSSAPQAAAIACETGIEPEWHAEVGEPYVSGFRVTVAESSAAVAFSNAYFAKYAQAGSSALVEQGKLQVGDRFRYLIFAHPRPESAAAPSRVRFRSSESAPVETSTASLAEFLALATPSGVHHADDFPVFLPRQLLDEVTEIYRAKPDTETGGVLVGGLRRNDADGQVFLEVTAQIPAQHTAAGATHLTFTAETWKAVRAALALRRRGEIWVGWWHSHPVRSWLTDASEAEGSKTTLSGGFFSAQDATVHRAAFVGAHCVALVVSDLGPQLETYSLFGWREGVVASRGFHVLERLTPTGDAAQAAPAMRRERSVGDG